MRNHLYYTCNHQVLSLQQIDCDSHDHYIHFTNVVDTGYSTRFQSHSTGSEQHKLREASPRLRARQTRSQKNWWTVPLLVVSGKNARMRKGDAQASR